MAKLSDYGMKWIKEKYKDSKTKVSKTKWTLCLDPDDKTIDSVIAFIIVEDNSEIYECEDLGLYKSEMFDSNESAIKDAKDTIKYISKEILKMEEY